MRSILQLLVAAAMAVQAGSPVHAQHNAYGGYDIAGAAGAEEAFYAETRGWKVFSSRVSGGFASCFAQINLTAQSDLRLGWDKMQWQLAVPLDMAPDWEGTLQIDGQGSGQGYAKGGATSRAPAPPAGRLPDWARRNLTACGKATRPF